MTTKSRSNTRAYTKRVHNSLPKGVASYSGYLSLDKTGGRCVYRSLPDRDSLLLAEFDPVVAKIERVDLADAERVYFNLPQMPRKVTFTLADASEYTPDQRATLVDGRVIYIECGYHSSKVEDPEMSQCLALARQTIEATGAFFVIVTERVARGYALENHRMLHGRRRPISDNEALRIAARELFQTAPTRLSIAEVVEQLVAASGATSLVDASEAAWCAVARADQSGHLIFDHRERLDAATKLAISSDVVAVSFFEQLLAGAWTPFPALYASPYATDEPAGIASSVALDTLTEEQRREFAVRLALVRRKREDATLTWSVLAAEFGMSVNRARHYWREYQRNGEGELLPGTRAKTGLRVCDELKETILRLWRNSRKFNARQVYDHPELRSRRAQLAAEGKRVDFTYEQLMRHLRPLRKDRLCTLMRAGKKRLPSPQASGTVDHIKQVVRPLQVLQVDSTPADVLCVTSDGKHVVKRAHILYGIDVASRCFANIEVLPQAESEADYLDLIHGVMSPKHDLLASIDSQLTEYPVYGIPEQILTDRAWEFGAEGSRERLIELGVDMQHAAAYLADMKGIVERAVQTGNQYLLHSLPGSTKSNPLAKGGRDAVAEALKYGITFERLTRFIKLFMIDGYADIVHSTLRMTPLEKWDRLVAAGGQPRRWPTDAAGTLGLKLFRLLRAGSRVRDHRGYQVFDHFYRPQRKDAPKDAIVFYDPRDIRSVAIYYADGAAAGTFCCEAVGTDFADMSRPIPQWLDAEARLPVAPTRPRNGRSRLTDVLAEAERGKRLKQRDATIYQQAVNAATALPVAPSIAGTPAPEPATNSNDETPLPDEADDTVREDDSDAYELPEYASAAG